MADALLGLSLDNDRAFAKPGKRDSEKLATRGTAMRNTLIAKAAAVAFLVAFAGVVGLAQPASAGAPMLFGLANQFDSNGQNPRSFLYEINPTTGGGREIGAIRGTDGTEYQNCSGMDTGPSGTMYATCERAGGSDAFLVTITLASGEAMEVGSTGVPPGDFGDMAGISDLSFRTTDGSLYAFVTFASVATLDLNTGTGMEVGPPMMLPPPAAGNAIAFSPNETLFYQSTIPDTASWQTIDPNDGSVLSSDVQGPDSFQGFPMPLSFPRLEAMDFDLDGILWGALASGTRDEGTLVSYLVTIDTGTGVVTHRASTVQGLDALTWVGSSGGSNETSPADLHVKRLKVVHGLLRTKWDNYLSVKGEFTLGEPNNGVDIPNESVDITVGSLSLSLPPGSFKTFRSKHVFRAFKDGMAIHMKIRQTSDNTSYVILRAIGADLSGMTQPVPVSLQIGDDLGRTSARVEKMRHKFGFKKRREANDDDDNEGDDDD